MDLVQGKIEDRLPTLLKELQTKARQKIKQELLAISKEKYALCYITLPSLLRATYSKPWKDCTEQERLDPYNGLLLCYNHSALYEGGYITFDGAREIHISLRLDERDYLKYGIGLKMQVNRFKGNEQYFKWHERNAFERDGLF